jgi:hypothetical protein
MRFLGSVAGYRRTEKINAGTVSGKFKNIQCR